jgi:hypothetical protein
VPSRLPASQSGQSGQSVFDLRLISTLCLWIFAMDLYNTSYNKSLQSIFAIFFIDLNTTSYLLYFPSNCEGKTRSQHHVIITTSNPSPSHRHAQRTNKDPMRYKCSTESDHERYQEIFSAFPYPNLGRLLCSQHCVTTSPRSNGHPIEPGTVHHSELV